MGGRAGYNRLGHQSPAICLGSCPVITPDSFLIGQLVATCSQRGAERQMRATAIRHVAMKRVVRLPCSGRQREHVQGGHIPVRNRAIGQANADCMSAHNVWAVAAVAQQATMDALAGANSVQSAEHLPATHLDLLL